MTQPDAWYEMFLAYSTLPSKRTNYQLWLLGKSLCNAIGHLYSGADCFCGGIHRLTNDLLRADFCYYQHLDSGGKG